MIYSIVTTSNLPAAIEQTLSSVAVEFAVRGALLRTTVLQSDHKICQSAISVKGEVEILSPWRKLCTDQTHKLIDQHYSCTTAKRYLRSFKHCNHQQKLIIATTVPQLLGVNCRKPCDLVFYLGQANQRIELTKKLARNYNIRQYDLSDPQQLKRVLEWLTNHNFKTAEAVHKGHKNSSI